MATMNTHYDEIHSFAEDFVICAGAVLVKRSTSEFCLIKTHDGFWNFPKGRKNIGETLEAAAVREAYEETGYTSSLLKIKMATRATTDDDVDDCVRLVSGITEPLMVSIRPCRSKQGGKKIIFWFLATIDETIHRVDDGTSMMSNEDFHVELVSITRALELLTSTWQHDLVKKASELLEKNTLSRH
jgi:8-oxo-dGTP pyrophosphatase MutT (NUDIX family)